MAAAQRKTTTTTAKSEVETAADTGKDVGTEDGTSRPADSSGGKAPAKNDKIIATPKAGLGKVAYEAYRNTVDGGDAMDDWDDVHGNDGDNGRQAAAWESAAQAVLNATFGKKEA